MRILISKTVCSQVSKPDEHREIIHEWVVAASINQSQVRHTQLQTRKWLVFR